VSALLRGRPARRMGGVRAGQQVAARLLATISLALVTLSRPETVVGGGAGDLRLAVASATADPMPAPLTGSGWASAGDDDVVVAPRLPGPADGAGEGEGASSGAVYEVERGDTFWDL